MLTLVKHTGTADQAEKEAESAVKSQLEEIKTKSQAAKDDVVKKLIEAVTSPNPTLHVNVK